MDAEFMALLRPYLRYPGDQTISGESRLRDLGLDSVPAIELLFAVEDANDVVIPDERLTDAHLRDRRLAVVGDRGAASVNAVRSSMDGSISQPAADAVRDRRRRLDGCLDDLEVSPA